jgi:hypothetical protein
MIARKGRPFDWGSDTVMLMEGDVALQQLINKNYSSHPIGDYLESEPDDDLIIPEPLLWKYGGILGT